MTRRTVYYSGRVQGVGFRATVRHLARGFVVTGFVRNLPDGRVELVAEGSQEEIRRFGSAIAGETSEFVTHVDERRGVATGEFAGFDVRR